MKLIHIFLVILTITTIQINAKSHKKNKNSYPDSDHGHGDHGHGGHGHGDHGPLFPVETSPSSYQDQTPPQHISETFYGGNPNTLPKDRSFLWSKFNKNQFGRPYYHGVVGPQWKVPVPDDSLPYKHISSPVPRSNYNHRIVPHDLPQRTHSHSSWELPKRKDVVQIDLPNSSTHTRERYFDPRFPMKKRVDVVSGSQYHDTGSTNPELNFGLNPEVSAANPQTVSSEFHSFVEKKKSKKNKSKIKKKNTKGDKQDDSQIRGLKQAAIEEAVNAEIRSRNLLNAMTRDPAQGDNGLILGVDVLNKREPIESLHSKNNAYNNTIEFWKNKKLGIRALNEKPFLPPPKY